MIGPTSTAGTEANRESKLQQGYTGSGQGSDYSGSGRKGDYDYSSTGGTGGTGGVGAYIPGMTAAQASRFRQLVSMGLPECCTGGQLT